ncbi:MAG: PsbP-related protein, partial [Candidatus Methanoperedens sp.]
MSARLLSGNKTMKKIILFFLIFIVLVNNASAYTFSNIGGDFKIEYPAGWNYIEEPDGTDQTFTSQTGRASVRVTVNPSDGKSLDETVGDRMRYLRESYGITPFSEKYVTVGGLKGKELMFYYNDEQKEYKYRQILIVSGDIYFIISAASLTSDFPFFSEDFEKIINSFILLKPAITPKVTAGYTPGRAPTPVQTETGAPTISLHAERTSILVGDEVLLKLSILSPIGKPKMEFQIILIPPSGMSVSGQEFSETGGQYSQKGTIEA